MNVPYVWFAHTWQIFKNSKNEIALVSRPYHANCIIDQELLFHGDPSRGCELHAELGLSWVIGVKNYLVYLILHG